MNWTVSADMAKTEGRALGKGGAWLACRVCAVTGESESLRSTPATACSSSDEDRIRRIDPPSGSAQSLALADVRAGWTGRGMGKGEPPIGWEGTEVGVAELCRWLSERGQPWAAVLGSGRLRGSR